MPDDLPQLVMERPTLAALPALVAPDGCALRSFAAGDEAVWVAIINEAFGFDHPAAWFHERLGDGHFRPERVWFVCVGDEPVATASAWLDPRRWDADTGVLHMVGARTAQRGRGLGRLACLAALWQMAAEGRTRARLLTDDFRLPAIRTYRSLGFAPLHTHESHAERWARVV
jgi:mycothiol synthase